ncbi:hypothetical protein [Chryseobacterium sp. HR92]|uniref:hypothetical protein n=1 Tax=Chryseobacterium sp. HR92 TaxID=3094839 RepID=UPI00388F0D78|nr:hypothetical protein SFA27_16775 [Chryseobacterium sp. HR92]
MKIFDVESKIEVNNKQLEFYYEMYDKLETKFSFLVVIYSFMFIYMIELFKYFIDADITLTNAVFIILFIVFLVFLGTSLHYTYLLQKPVDIHYLNEPNHFYIDKLNEYKTKLNYNDELNSDDEYILNEYVNLTYLDEQEIALSKNIKAYRKKRGLYYKNFNIILLCLVLYVFISSFVIFEKRKENTSFDLKNYKEVINYLNSKKMSEKPKVDPKMVIPGNPVAVKQGGVTSTPKETIRQVPKINKDKR